MRNSDLIGELGTTGDRRIDAAIARFIHDPRELPCDSVNSWARWWQEGGLDGVPEPSLRDLPHLYVGRRQPGRDEAESTLTRSEIMEARA